MPVRVEGELHPQPPDRGEQHQEARQVAKPGVILECASQLAYGADKYQVEEQLQPACPPLLTVVPVSCAQGRRVQVYRMRQRGGEPGLRFHSSPYLLRPAVRRPRPRLVYMTDMPFWPWSGACWRDRVVGADQVLRVDSRLDATEPVICGGGPEGSGVPAGIGQVEVHLRRGPA